VLYMTNLLGQDNITVYGISGSGRNWEKEGLYPAEQAGNRVNGGMWLKYSNRIYQVSSETIDKRNEQR